MSKVKEPAVSEDEFDPAYVEKHENALEDRSTDVQEEVKAMLRRRKEAYCRVFSKGATDQADVDIVLADMFKFCRGGTPTFDVKDGIHADTLMKIKEGRREFYNRVLDFTGLDADTLYLKYTGQN